MKTIKITYSEYIAITTMIKHESQYYIEEDRAQELFEMFLHVIRPLVNYGDTESFKLQVTN